LLYRIVEWEAKYYNEFQKLEPKPFGIGISETPEVTLPLWKDAAEKLLSDAGAALEVQSLTRNPGGFSKQTYFATVRQKDSSTEDIIIRLGDDTPLLNVNIFNLAKEFGLLARLHELGFPCLKSVDLIYHAMTKRLCFPRCTESPAPWFLIY
jgi:hypothetical protein